MALFLFLQNPFAKMLGNKLSWAKSKTLALTRLGKGWPQRLALVAWRAGQGVRDGVGDDQNKIWQPHLETAFRRASCFRGVTAQSPWGF